ncbi:hypothetical protein [Cellvibrio polysaccharolyticus]|uniref:Cytochrome c family protein n=1 Tax=Cellvibrio polysaccharolyticus TaxID=2082724 RepID=A0A928V1U8_9GAMM|nr:hypothetical protein [Cellvibrio polysaccharolyticus]MBE8717235.1 hypothetical protein [Cellvibrio polysaccharolyticus]
MYTCVRWPRPLTLRFIFLTLFILLTTACHSPDVAIEPAGKVHALQAVATATPCNLPAVPPAASSSLAAFSHYSWQQFTALNWPAQAGVRGQPDCSKKIGDAGVRVWETYKTTDQLFLPDAANPGPWSAGEITAFDLKYRAKANDALPVEESIRQAVGGWLIDQYRNPTYYSISVNQNSYDYVVSQGFYDQNRVANAAHIRFPDNALEVKAAWRILTPSDDSSRYHTMNAMVTRYDDQGNPSGKEQQKVGLVGFHIVRKADNFPQWIWATFEHVDNTPDKSGQFASYYNPHCSGNYCTPNQSPVANKQPFDEPNQLTRVTAIDSEVAAINQQWQQQFEGTPFAYYQLVSPQWPEDPLDPGNPQGTPTPGVVANTVMESYIQPTSSCMDCHSTARVPGNRVKSDYSFIFLFAQPVSSNPQQGAQ